MPRSLQGRLLALVVGLVVAVWLATATLTWIDARHELDELLDSHLAQAAALLVVQQAGEIDDDHGALDAPTLHRYAPKVAFQVFHDGRLALRSVNAPVAPMLELHGRAADGFSTVEIGARAWRVFATRGRENDVQVFVGEQVESRNAILWAVLRSALGPMLLAIPLLALAAWFAVSRGLAPLRLLGRTLAQRRPDALEPVAVRGAPSEMAPMLEALNGLFQRIGELLESERRFTADAAHELRTPIAAIRAQAQVALGAAADDERRRALHATLRGCDRATRLVEQLLTLSRLESGAAPALVAVDLAALARQVVAEAAPAAIEKQQTIEVDADEPCPVQGDATLLAVMLRNLVDNAVRYSPEGATVKLAVRHVEGAPRLLLDDSGPGLSPADLQRVGERFFRVVGSGQEGSGLGWSIARRIAAVHRAQVRVGRSGSLGGLSVEVDFPLDGAVPTQPRARTPP
jgi:two-component system sensor histidine kinase QseC